MDIDFLQVSEEYKKKQFLNAVKNGKKAIRRGLATRLFHLAGYVRSGYDLPWSTLRKTYKNEFDTLMEINTMGGYDGTSEYKHAAVQDINFHKILSLFLGKHDLLSNGYDYNLFYNKSKICWGILDEALKIAYPDNHKINENGFVYLDILSFDLKMIEKNRHNFFNPYKHEKTI